VRIIREVLSFVKEVFGDLSSIMLTDNYLKYRENNIRNAMDVLYWSDITGLCKPKVSDDAQSIVNAIFEYMERS